MNQVAPSQERQFDDRGNFVGFYDPPVYRQTSFMPELVARGILPIRYLELGERFAGCETAEHVRDVLMSEGHYPRPRNEEWREGYDRRIRAARARVKKRRQRSILP